MQLVAEHMKLMNPFFNKTERLGNVALQGL